MRSSATWALSVACLVSSGCDLEPEPAKTKLIEQPQQKDAPRAQPHEASEKKSYGAPLSDREPTTLLAVLEDPTAYADKEILVAGKVRRVCTRKGCWMEVSEGEAEDAPGARVTFKDYAFFVPTTSAGKDARVEGKVVVKQIEPKTVEHLESEGGTLREKKADGSAVEVQIVARGVELSQG